MKTPASIKKKLILSFLFAVPFLTFSQKKAVEDDFIPGKELYELGDKKFALKHFLAIISSNPNHAEALYMAGKCYEESTQKDKASEYYLKAFAINQEMSSYSSY